MTALERAKEKAFEKFEDTVLDPRSSEEDVRRALREIDIFHDPLLSGAARRTLEGRSPKHFHPGKDT